MEYKASYDRLVIIATTIVVLFLGVLFFIFLMVFPHGSSEIVVKTLVLTFIILIPIVNFLFSPRGYIINEEEIRVTRIVKSRSIKFVDIIDISIPDEKLMKESGRAGGTGGLFGHYGNYYNKNFGGDMKWYATQLKKFVIIKAKKTKSDYSSPNSKKIKVIVLTPDNNLEFFEDLKSKLKTLNTKPLTDLLK